MSKGPLRLQFIPQNSPNNNNACVHAVHVYGEKKGKRGGRRASGNKRTNIQTRMIKCIKQNVNNRCIWHKYMYLHYLCNFSLSLILFPTQKNTMIQAKKSCSQVLRWR